MKAFTVIGISAVIAVAIFVLVIPSIPSLFSPIDVTIKGNAVISGNGTHYRSPDNFISFRPSAAEVYFIDEATKTYTHNQTIYDHNFSNPESIPRYEIQVQNGKSYLVLLQYWFEYWHYYCSAGHINVLSNSPSYDLDLNCDASKDDFDIYTVLPADPS